MFDAEHADGLKISDVFLIFVSHLSRDSGHIKDTGNRQSNVETTQAPGVS